MKKSEMEKINQDWGKLFLSRFPKEMPYRMHNSSCVPDIETINFTPVSVLDMEHIGDYQKPKTLVRKPNKRDNK